MFIVRFTYESVKREDEDLGVEVPDGLRVDASDCILLENLWIE